jgi:hypothetical protein
MPIRLYVSDFSSHDKDEVLTKALNVVLLCRIFGYMTVLIPCECISAVLVARFAALLSYVFRVLEENIKLI